MIKLGKNDSWEQGFGLIDTLIATVLLGIAVVAMLAGFTYASAGVRENRERIQATMLMQETMENLKQNDGVVEAKFDLSVAVPADVTETTKTSTKVVYTVTLSSGVEYTLTASSAAANSLTKLQAVTLTVAWSEAEKPRSMTMVEYIYLK